MERNIYNMGETLSEILSDSLSKFVVGIDGKENIEGVFLSPYGVGETVSGFVIGVVYNGNIVDNIMGADRLPLYKAYHETGYNFDVRPVTIDWYRGELGDGESDYFPVKGMLKNGSIFYDKNGTLAEIKKELVNDTSIVGKSHVTVRPSIQYKKVI